jgi:uncharacterized protein YukE
VGEITSIEVPQLHQVGDAVHEVAGRLGQIKDRLHDLGYHSDGAVEGSLTSESSLGAVALTWSYAFENLARDVQEYAANLHRAATDYQRSDDEAAARIREAGS